MSLIKKEISLPLGMSIEHTGTVMELFAKLSIIFLNSGRTGGLKLKKKTYQLLREVHYMHLNKYLDDVSEKAAF